MYGGGNSHLIRLNVIIHFLHGSNCYFDISHSVKIKIFMHVTCKLFYHF